MFNYFLKGQNTLIFKITKIVDVNYFILLIVRQFKITQTIIRLI